MVLENPLLPYLTWLLGFNSSEEGAFLNSALFRFLVTAAVLAVVALVVGFLIALVRRGPMKAGDTTYRVVMNGFRELFRTSPRRVSGRPSRQARPRKRRSRSRSRFRRSSDDGPALRSPHEALRAWSGLHGLSTCFSI